MSFNLKRYAAAKQSPPVAEKQLRDGVTTDAPQQTHERQLDGLRVQAPNRLTERQLASRQTDKAPKTLSEKQLVPQREEAPNRTHERQLDAVRTDKSPEALIEATMHAEAVAAGRVVIAQDIGRKHQEKIALDTLKLSAMGASVMGGMNHAEAIKFLRSIGYNDLRITNLLVKAGWGAKEIQDMMGGSETIRQSAGRVDQAVRRSLPRVTPSIGLPELEKYCKDCGHGLALVDRNTDKVIAPYVDPSDYPDLRFASCQSGTASTDGKYYIMFHDGILETDPDYLTQESHDKRNRNSQTRTAAAANLSDDHTERRLRGESDVAAPDTIHEEQLGKLRVDKELPLAEKYLEKNRTDDVTTTIEGRLNKAKGGFHQHRNSETSKGDLNQLEAQRVADKKRQEAEKVKPASETPKELRFYEEAPGKDGIRLAQAQVLDFPVTDTDDDIHTGPSDDAEEQTVDQLSEEDLRRRVMEQDQELAAYREVLREEEGVDGDDDEALGDDGFEITEKARQPVVIPQNPDGPAGGQAFEVDDQLVGSSDSTGTPIEERVLLYDKQKLSYLSDEQISDQAVRYLRQKYPSANLDENSIMHLEGDANTGEIRYTLVGRGAAV